MPEWLPRRRPGLPKPETITVHPGERWNLDAQLPTALVFGERIATDITIAESYAVTFGTIRLHFDDGTDVTCTLGKAPPEPQRWIKCDPVTGMPLDQFGLPSVEGVS